MNKRSEYRSFKNHEDIMFKKLKRACMKEYHEFRMKFHDCSFNDFYKDMLRNHHLDYIKHSYRSWKNGPGATQEYSKKLIMKGISKKMIEEGRKRHNKIERNYEIV